MSGDGEFFNLQEILRGLNVTMTQFIHGCVAARYDYLKNVRGVGVNKAFMFVKAGTLFQELKKKDASDDYERMFKKAVSVFTHQTVFNPTKQQVQPLQEWGEDPSEELQDDCGTYPFSFNNSFKFKLHYACTVYSTHNHVSCKLEQ